MATAAAEAVLHPQAGELAEPRVSERLVAWLFAGTGVAVIAAMGVGGLVMRLTQADVLHVSPSWFYRVLTLHGAGMLVGGLLAMMGALWFVLRPHVPLSLARMLWSYATILAGALAVIVAVLIGGFAAGWTFLTPLPFLAAGQWDTWATALFLVGLVGVGAGFMVFCVDVLAKTTATYGGLSRSLGIPFLRNRDDSPPPPQALAGVVVAIDGLLASAVGTTIVLALLGKTLDSGVQLDPLWAKNLTYFFGHSVFNLIIYLAAGTIYVLVPRYAGRPWKTTKPIVVGWLATLVFVATAYSHHLYMDFVQPAFAQYVSMTASFAASLPVAVVTAYTGLMLVYGSRYRWTLASALLYLGFMGWVIGGTGAVLDGLIPLNFRFHNTLWVTAHFHTYLLMCVVFWVLAFVVHLLELASRRTASRGRGALAVVLMLVGGYGLVGAWYLSGVLGLPRRYAVQPAGTDGYSLAGGIFALVFALGFLAVLVEIAILARAALRARRFEAVETRSAWDGSRHVSLRERAAGPPAPAEPGPEAAVPDGAPVASYGQLAGTVAAATVALAAFLPPVVNAASSSTRWHHLDHGGQFFLGAALGIALASFPGLARRTGMHLPGVALGASIVAPAAMLLVMLPSVYEPLEGHDGLHFLYHVGIAALGFATGLGAGRLGRVTGRLVFCLSIGMALMYAAGATGG